MSGLATRKRRRLKEVLDRFYDTYDFAGALRNDPIEFPHRYRSPADIEVVAFIASCFAYGRVDLFKPVVEKILFVMGERPSLVLMDFDVRRHGTLFSLKYRFNETKDIVCLLFILHRLLERHATLEGAFLPHYRADDPDTGSVIAGFVDEALSIDTSPVYGNDERPPGFVQFFPSPRKGSACKRMNLFLRWMTRDRDIDFGIWKGIPKERLVIPLDTHITRIGRCLGLTRRKSSDWKTAVEITDSLRALDPEDPLKYDFALCHHGISGLCTGQESRAKCRDCVFKHHAA